MLCREIIAVCSQIHIKHTNTLYGQKVQLLNVKLAVRSMITNLPVMSLKPIKTQSSLRLYLSD